MINNTPQKQLGHSCPFLLIESSLSATQTDAVEEFKTCTYRSPVREEAHAKKKSMMETFGVYILDKGKGDKITEINTNQR